MFSIEGSGEGGRGRGNMGTVAALKPMRCNQGCQRSGNGEGRNKILECQ